MRYFAIAVTFLMSAFGLNAQTFGQLDTSFFNAKQELDAIRQEFADSADAALADYLAYESKLFEEYEAFKQEVMQTWGDTSMVESTRKEWVEYSDDKTTRTSVNWEDGKVSVEVLVDPADDDELVRMKLEQAVMGLLTSRGSTSGFESSVLPDRPLSDKPLLDGQIDLSKYGVESLPVVTSSAPKPFENRTSAAPAPGRSGALDLSRNKPGTSVAPRPQGQTLADRTLAKQKEEAAKKPVATSTASAAQKADLKAKEQAALSALTAAVVASQKPKTQTVNTSEGSKNVVKITMELVEDHLPKRAEQFKGMVSRHSATYSVDEPLIYAIMEQESAFNPAAQSWVPAYGLMQLVPKSGGRDAYRYVHKKDQIPSPEFLFDANNNIQLGTGYLKLLMSTTFSKINDPKCRMLCAIAAYNTGAGNVSRAINGTTNISKAIPTINTMSYDQLFAHLKQHLPHAETKDYIQKVTSKMQKYIK